MAKIARMLNNSEELKQLGLKPHTVEQWEDGKRSEDHKGDFEWWYFDSIMEDGTSVVVHVNTKQPETMQKDGSHPIVIITITTPDGTIYTDSIPYYDANQFSFSKDTCDVKVGPHYVHGDLTDYTIHVEPVNGIGADLKLHNLRKSWRPGSGHLKWGEGKGMLTWLFVVPRGDISGTITYGGKTLEVQGSGYHDHQWGHGAATFFNVNHWLWGRHNYEDYTILIFDMVASKKWNNQRFPIFCIQDENGDVVFESTQMNDKFHCEVLEEAFDEEIGRNFPHKIRYTAQNDNVKFTYELTNNLVIGRKDRYKEMPKPVRWVMDLLKVAPAYARYKADGVLTMEIDGQKIHREGEMIYEFAYFSRSYKEAMTV